MSYGSANVPGKLTAEQVGAAPANHGTHVTYSTTAPKMDGTAAVGTAGTVARSDHVHPTDTSRAPANHTHTAAQVGAAASNHTHTAAQVGAAASNHTHTAAQVGAVPTTRKVNNKPLSGDISLTASDVGAAAASHSHAGVTGIIPVANGGTGNNSGYIRTGQSSGSTIGDKATAEGDSTGASGYASHAEGAYTTASGWAAHVEGTDTTASGKTSHAEGNWTNATAFAAHSEGYATHATETCAHAGGWYVIASGKYQTAIGKWNVEYADSNLGLLIVGKGTDKDSRANCFRVSSNGLYAAGSYNASGADYAELFEWADGNPAGEDRVGRFVTLSGDKIRLAVPEDDYILGIVSGNPSVVGDVHDDQWQGMYLYDVFGRPLWEDVEVPNETVEEPDPEHPGQTITRVIIPAHTEHRQKLNPNYDNTQKYQARTERPEWDAVGLMGKLVAVDDGTCRVDGYCTVGEGGIATASVDRTRYRVMRRLDETHVQLMILP